MILVSSSPKTVIRDVGRPRNLGILSAPRSVYVDAPSEGFYWAADNDVFGAWDENRFLAMLDKIRHLPGCLFVTAPDVVGDADSTLMRFWEWEPRIRATGQPIAFVAQDGIENSSVPWGAIDALFIGGSTEFKLGATAAMFAREARSYGKWLHMGRVNSRKRIRYAKSIGCDSVDGTGFCMYQRTNLPWALEWAGAEQLWSAA